MEDGSIAPSPSQPHHHHHHHPDSQPGAAGSEGEGGSLESSTLALLGDLDPSRSHHLLKHSLSDGQRVDARQHFSSYDVREAAKDISRMGQRELQTKFKLVYGTSTHSNNNDWLRRKLYEAIGAVPIKTAARNRTRKAGSKSRARSAHDGGALPPALAAAAQDCRRQRTPRGSPRAPAPGVWGHRLLGLSMPPFVGAARPGARVSRSISPESEDDSSSNDEDESSAPGARARAHNGSCTPQSAPSGFRATARPAAYQASPAAAAKPSRSTLSEGPTLVPIPVQPGFMRSVPSMTFSSHTADFLLQETEWMSDAWGEAAGPSFSLPPALRAAAGKDVDDLVLLPLDLSVFDAVL